MLVTVTYQSSKIQKKCDSCPVRLALKHTITSQVVTELYSTLTHPLKPMCNHKLLSYTINWDKKWALKLEREESACISLYPLKIK